MGDPKPIKQLVAVRINPDLHARAKRLSSDEEAAGRRLTVSDIYETALRFFLDAAGRNNGKVY